MVIQEQQDFRELVSSFLDRWCDCGAELSVSDRPLSTKFRDFWTRVTKTSASTTPLDEFHAELIQRGYLLVAGPHPIWSGLKLRKKYRRPPTSNLSERQSEVLTLLTQRDLWSVTEIARALKCSLTTASRTVDRLERKRLVRCTTEATDPRRLQVRLTTLGSESVQAFQTEQ
jgi:DNA-binding MarR family transcriptional regulator